MKAIELADRLFAVGPVLDFGSGTGELGRLLTADVTYDFVEQDDAAAEYLLQKMPAAIRRSLESAPTGHYGSVFALDSLEHNDDFVELLGQLGQKLRPGGVLIICGPTENAMYRMGRRIAGFSAHYHKTTVREIESAAANSMHRLAMTVLPARIAPLFRISGWTTSATE